MNKCEKLVNTNSRKHVYNLSVFIHMNSKVLNVFMQALQNVVTVGAMKTTYMEGSHKTQCMYKCDKYLNTDGTEKVNYNKPFNTNTNTNTKKGKLKIG